MKVKAFQMQLSFRAERGIPARSTGPRVGMVDSAGVPLRYTPAALSMTVLWGHGWLLESQRKWHTSYS